MGFVTYKNHANVVRNLDRDVRDRVWALRSCCFAVSGTTWHTLLPNEIVELVSRHVGCQVETRSHDKLVITSQLESAILWLTKFRLRLISQLDDYHVRRRFAKSTAKRFPVSPPFDRAFLIQIAASV